MQLLVWIVPACLVGLLAILFVPSWRARQRLELRAQVLELLATAARRGASFGGLLALAAREHRGRRRRTLEKAASRLAEGAPLSEALADSEPGLFAAHSVAAIRASEGTAQMPAVLTSLAKESAKALSARHRLYMTLCYPVILGLFLLGTQMFYADLARMLPGAERHGSSLVAAIGVGAAWLVLVAPVAYRLLLRRWTTLRRLVERGIHAVPALQRLEELVGGERLLRSTAALVGAGLSLPAALRRAAAATGQPRLASDARASAELMESGAPALQAWERTRLPEFAAVRAALVSGVPAPRLASALDALATECGHRFAASSDRLLRWVHPLAIAVFGGLLALQFTGIFQLVYGMHREAGLW